MKCPKCGAEMKEGYLFGTKDGALSFANHVPSAFENAKKVKGFIEIKPLKAGGRISIKTNCCEKCRILLFEY